MMRHGLEPRPARRVRPRGAGRLHRRHRPQRQHAAVQGARHGPGRLLGRRAVLDLELRRAAQPAPAAAARRSRTARSGPPSARRAYGGWDRLDAERATALRRVADRQHPLPAALERRRAARFAADLDEYADLLGGLYAAIRDESGARVVVDNSKQTGAALVARRAPGVQLQVVHLVRRSHGVAYSWTKHVPRSDMEGREMRRRPPGRTARAWTTDNALFETLGRVRHPAAARALRGLRRRAAPARRERLLDFLGARPGPGGLDFITGDDRRPRRRPQRVGQPDAAAHRARAAAPGRRLARGLSPASAAG